MIDYSNWPRWRTVASGRVSQVIPEHNAYYDVKCRKRLFEFFSTIFFATVNYVSKTGIQMNLLHNPHHLTVVAPAKVNWYLELLRKRNDGFHQIETFMSTVSLYDTISFAPRGDHELNLKVLQGCTSDAESIPLGPDNLVLRAIESVRARCAGAVAKQGFDIVLHKRIPSAAGLGGASSDAAATIKAINGLLGSPLGAGQLYELAATLGSDVPFFLRGGTAFCEGRGERISPLAAPVGQWIVIAKPPTGLSTPEVYSQVVISQRQRDASEFGLRLKTGKPSLIGDWMHNRLQPFAIPLNDEIKVIQNEFQLLQDAGRCCGHQLSGSGSSYFGLFSTKRLATTATVKLTGRAPGFRYFCCRTTGSYGLGKSDHGATAA